MVRRRDIKIRERGAEMAGEIFRCEKVREREIHNETEKDREN